MFDDIEKNIKQYKKGNLLSGKYYSLLDNIGKFISKYEIDISSINESIIDKINKYCKICSLTTTARFSEPEDEINIDNDEENNNYEENTSDEDQENTSNENSEINDAKLYTIL